MNPTPPMYKYHPSPRINFQLKYFYMTPKPADGCEPNVLNIGCSDDPLSFGELARHYDLDDWSWKHKFFTRGDAHQLPFLDQSYETVIMGDIVEHLVDPWKAIQEGLRVCKDTFICTIFEEWRLPGHGQFIEEGRARGNQESQLSGFDTYTEQHNNTYPQTEVFDEDVTPHLIHINQFDDMDIMGLVQNIQAKGFEIVEYVKVPEAKAPDGHIWSNWLIAARRRAQ